MLHDLFKVAIANHDTELINKLITYIRYFAVRTAALGIILVRGVDVIFSKHYLVRLSVFNRM